MPLILSTKKLTFIQRQHLLDANIQVIEADFIKTEIISFTKLKTLPNRLIFTSQNAVRSVLQHSENKILKKIPVFCVGRKTATLLQENGWQVEKHWDYATDLAKEVASHHKQHRYTFFTGNIRSPQIGTIFREKRISLEEVQTYRTYLTSHQIKNKVQGILFFSPSGVESYLQKNSFGDEALFCIGNVTAKAVMGNSNRVMVASQPTIESVIVRCIKYFEAGSKQISR